MSTSYLETGVELLVTSNPFNHGRCDCRLSESAEDYLVTPLDLTEYLIENKATTFMAGAHLS